MVKAQAGDSRDRRVDEVEPSLDHVTVGLENRRLGFHHLGKGQ